MSRAIRLALLVPGLALLAGFEHDLDPSALAWLGLALLLPVVLLFTDCGPFIGLARRINALAPRQRTRAAVAVGTASFLFFLVMAVVYERPLFPVWHDEQMHAVQLRLLATGRLWTATHPMADFFETFHVLNHPVYAPMHFPGTAILNVAGVWLHLPLGIIPLLLASAGCALTYVVVAGLVGDLGGLVAAGFLWASADVRMLATMLMSHNALLCLAPLAMWLYLGWRRAKSKRWALALGAAIGLMAITRPLEAVAFAAPIGIAVLIETLGRNAVRTALLMCAATTPFLAVQLVFDKGVTGSWLYPPYQYYNDTAYPYTSFASERPGAETRIAHVSDLPQKQSYYEFFMLAAGRSYVQQPFFIQILHRLVVLFRATLPSSLMLVFLPLGLFGMTRSLPRMVVGLPAVLVFGFYLLHVFFPPHYAVMVITPVAALTLIGIVTLLEVIPPERSSVRAAVFATGGCAVALSLPPFSAMHRSEYSTKQFGMVELTRRVLIKEAKKPAILFFRYSPNVSFHDEPVYNYETVNPDDARVVLAQSFGARNFDLVHYYHALGQNRHVYEVDRATGRMYYVGRVNDIDRSRPATAPATVPATPQP